MLPEVRMTRVFSAMQVHCRVDALRLHRAKRLSCLEAGELLGISERQFRRLRDAFDEGGEEGLVDRRRGRANGRRAPVDEIAWALKEFTTRHFDFTPNVIVIMRISHPFTDIL